MSEIGRWLSGCWISFRVWEIDNFDTRLNIKKRNKVKWFIQPACPNVGSVYNYQSDNEIEDVVIM